jgi:hypothetical protein
MQPKQKGEISVAFDVKSTGVISGLGTALWFGALGRKVNISLYFWLCLITLLLEVWAIKHIFCDVNCAGFTRSLSF